jgi:hypothetical protein
MSFILLLEQGAIVSAGGGYSDIIFACLEPIDALRLRVVSKRCTMLLAQQYQPQEVLLRRDLTLLLKCFPKVTRIVCAFTDSAPNRVPESEWKAAADAGLLGKLTAVHLRDNCKYHCEDERNVRLGHGWMRTMCGLPNLTAISVPAGAMPGACIVELCCVNTLRVVDFSRYGYLLSDKEVQLLLRHSARTLESLYFGGQDESEVNRCQILTDAAFDALPQCQALHSLVISGMDQLSARGMESICLAPKLQTLQLRECSDALAEDDAALAHLSRCACLTEFVIDNARSISPRGMELICQAPQLQSLRLENCESGMDAVALAPLQLCANLSTLSIDGLIASESFDEDGFVSSVALIPRLASLKFPYITPRAMSALAQHRGGMLTHLDRSGNSGPRVEDMRGLFDSLPQFSALTTLNLARSFLETRPLVDDALGDQLVAALEQLPLLTSLDVAECCFITDRRCARIAALPMLRQLSVARNRDKRSDRGGLRAIAENPRLTSLDVSECLMTDQLFERMSQHCRSLTALKMRRLFVSVGSVAHLAKLPYLRWSQVDAEGCRRTVQDAVKDRQRWLRQ